MSKKMLLIMVLLLTLLLLVFYFLFFYDFSGRDGEQVFKNEKNKIILPDSDNKKDELDANDKEVKENKITKIKKEDEVDATESILRKRVFFFTERLGTYSNQSNFENIKDLKLFMTDNMQKWADNFLDEQSKKEYVGSYKGTTTRAISAEFLKLDKENNFAMISVDVQRVSSDSRGNEKLTKSKLVVDFILVDDRWLVDKINWK